MEGLTTNQIFVLALCILVISGGILFITKVVAFKDLVLLAPKLYAHSERNAEVEPAASQEGTVFLIKGYSPERKEQRDMQVNLKNEDYIETLVLFDDGKHSDGKAGDGTYGGFFDSAGKPVGGYEITNGVTLLNSFIVYRQECNNISGDNANDKINWVILPYEYNDIETFRKDAINLLAGEDSIMSVEPFKSNADKFSFSIVQANQDLGCQVGCKGVPTLVCCNNRIIAEEASQCSFDNAIILLNSTGICGSSSLYAKACAKNRISSMFLMHEMGHNFGGLADEYTYSTQFGDYSIGEINAANCDVAGCLKWRNITNGCLKGCTYSELYRSEGRNSIMYGYTPVFNVVSQIEIMRIINLVIKQKEIDKSNEEKSYFVNINYNQGKIEIKDIFSKPIRAPTQVLQTGYTAEIKDSNNIVLFRSYLKVPEIIMPLPNSSSSFVREEQFEFSAILPYFQNANSLEIRRADEVLANASIAALSGLCGDDVCSEGENHLSCAQDCAIKDNFCQTSGCDPDCPSQKECEKRVRWEIIAAVVVILLGICAMLIILIRSRK